MAATDEEPTEEPGGWVDVEDGEHKKGLTEMYERIAELEHSQSQLKKMNEEMRHLLETADDEVTELLLRNTTLTNQVKTLERTISDMEQAELDLCEVRHLLANEQSMNISKEKEIHELEKEQNVLREQDAKITAELNRLQHQGQQDEINISNLGAALQTLQQQMEETKLELKQRDEIIHQQNWQLQELEEVRDESSSIIKDLKLRIQDFKSQLEMHQEDASCAEQDGSMAAEGGSPDHPLSLAEEIDFLASSSAEDTEVEEQKEWVKQDAVKGQVKSGWHTCIRHLVNWARLIIITLGVLIPLGVVACVALETYQQNSREIYSNTLWTIVYTIRHNYCSVQHVGLPAI